MTPTRTGGSGVAADADRDHRTVVPITSNVDRIYPFQVLLSAGAGGLSQDSKAQAEQVRSLDAQRIGEHVGRLSEQLMATLDDALRLHLAL